MPRSDHDPIAAFAKRYDMRWHDADGNWLTVDELTEEMWKIQRQYVQQVFHPPLPAPEVGGQLQAVDPKPAALSDSAVAIALDVFNREERYGRTEAMRKAIAAALGGES